MKPTIPQPLMEISYEPRNRAFWHMNCTGQHHAPPMKFAGHPPRDGKPGSLMECTACAQRGWYQAGWVGLARVPVEGNAGVMGAAPADWTDDAACLSGLADRLEEESATESDRGNDSAACAWTCRAYELRQIVSRMVRSTTGVLGAAAKLCNYCGVVIDSGMACMTDGEFNHCPNKQIGEAIGGVLASGALDDLRARPEFAAWYERHREVLHARSPKEAAYFSYCAGIGAAGVLAAAPAASYWCNKCGAHPPASRHQRPDGKPCDYLAATYGVSVSDHQGETSQVPMPPGKA